MHFAMFFKVCVWATRPAKSAQREARRLPRVHRRAAKSRSERLPSFLSHFYLKTPPKWNQIPRESSDHPCPCPLGVKIIPICALVVLYFSVVILKDNKNGGNTCYDPPTASPQLYRLGMPPIMIGGTSKILSSHLVTQFRSTAVSGYTVKNTVYHPFI